MASAISTAAEIAAALEALIGPEFSAWGKLVRHQDIAGGFVI